MAKSLKRAGIIFFVLVISCLLILGITTVANVQSDKDKILDTNNNMQNTVAENISLVGNNAEMAKLWNDACVESKEKNITVSVVLGQNWIANNDEMHTFGTGVGFYNGAIAVPAGVKIKLYLNSFTINRNLTEETENGSVIYLCGTLDLYDDTLTTNKTTTGKITGGNNVKSGGGILIENGGTLNFFSGILENNSAANGGAIFVRQKCTLNMYGGIMRNNSAKYGGGVCVKYTNFNLFDGIIDNNTASSHGGGILVASEKGGEIGYFNMYGGIVSNNTSCYGGIVFHDQAVAVINDGEIHDNLGTSHSGGIEVWASAQLTVNGGKFYNNKVRREESVAGHNGGGAIFVGSTSSLVVNGGEFYNNSIKVSSNALDYVKGGALAAIDNSEITLNGGVIRNNTCIGNNGTNLSYGGGVAIDSNNTLNIGAGVQIYNNKLEIVNNPAGAVENNLYIKSPKNINIIENLMKDGKNTHIGITLSDSIGSFTSDYSKTNTLAPKTFFFSDISGKAVTLNSEGEAQLVSGTKPTTNITWRWGTGANDYTTDSQVTLPYTGMDYNINIGGGSFYKNTSGSSAISGTSFAINDCGSYTFYADGNYLNPTFEVTIKKAKNEIVKPTLKKYTLIYNYGNPVTFLPEGFNPETMEIDYNTQTEMGKHVAQIRLKYIYNSVWAGDNSFNNLQYEYEIIHPGIVAKDGISYEYVYQDNNIRKSYLSEKYIHRVNDTDIATIDGNIRYVLGGISTNTKLSVFLNNLRNDLKLIKIYDKNGIVYDGIASNGVIPESVANILVGTGFKVELYENSTATTAFDTVYISVLGDINGDGRITASDIAYLREIAKDNSILNTMFVEYQLAAMVNNKGGVTNIDSEILYNVMANEIELNIFFKSGVNTDSSYKYLTLNKENGKYERVVSDTATNVIGNVAVNTKVSEFKANLALLGVNTIGLTIYKNEQELDDNAIVGTGCYFEIAGVKTYISVLGDLNGDGRISASDIMYARELIKGDKQAVQDCVLLSALILNTGSITSADSIVLEVVLEYSINISNY